MNENLIEDRGEKEGNILKILAYSPNKVQFYTGRYGNSFCGGGVYEE